jgi:hypothetical protein
MNSSNANPRDSIGRLSVPPVFVMIAAMLGCFALPSARAVSPAPDGGYANGNTAEGDNALLSLTSGAYNTAIGFDALVFNTTGTYNTATGSLALFSNKTGNFDTADGFEALAFNTTGYKNTATGFQALLGNTTGHDNTASGFYALYYNTGNNNTATGSQALFNNTTGTDNTANGFDALVNNTTGSSNTADGSQALQNNTAGVNNTATGFEALVNNTGSSNTALGVFAGANLTTGDDNIDIGNRGVAGESATIRLGDNAIHAKTFIAAIRGATTGNADAIAVVIDSGGQLGTVSSSRRFKKDIGPMDKASEAILALKPVTFHYKSDSKGTPQFGLIAEEVAKVNPDLVVRDADGEVYTVRYEAVNAMLLNEFLKEHRTVLELKKEIAALTATMKEQASQIQQVRAEFEVANSAPQVVVKNQ